MDENIPQTVEEIEKSKWFKKLYKPEIIAGLESGAELWLKKHGTKSKVGKQLHAALPKVSSPQDHPAKHNSPNDSLPASKQTAFEGLRHLARHTDQS